uniref:Large ribosomal subunit protein uL11 N-terminal domain-containing protein n=1 Tax=Serinus canaria TaxID=9135 RepID=A0A8C9UE20_SERCA
PPRVVPQSPKKVGDDIAKATGDWKGLRITVKLTIQNRQAQIEVVPSASALIIKALKEPPRDRKKQKNSKCSPGFGSQYFGVKREEIPVPFSGIIQHKLANGTQGGFWASLQCQSTSSAHQQSSVFEEIMADYGVMGWFGLGGT